MAKLIFGEKAKIDFEEERRRLDKFERDRFQDFEDKRKYYLNLAGIAERGCTIEMAREIAEGVNLGYMVEEDWLEHGEGLFATYMVLYEEISFAEESTYLSKEEFEERTRKEIENEELQQEREKRKRIRLNNDSRLSSKLQREDTQAKKYWDNKREKTMKRGKSQPTLLRDILTGMKV